MKILTAYFTYTTHTRGAAEQIHGRVGGDLFEIRPAESYSEDYDTTERQGRKEIREGYRPALAEQIKNLDTYDVILLGTPNWFNTIAPPVATFLAENDFSGKKLAVFCTNGGDGLGHIEGDVKSLSGNAEIMESLNLYEDGGADAGKKVEAWLKKNGLKQ